MNYYRDVYKTARKVAVNGIALFGTGVLIGATANELRHVKKEASKKVSEVKQKFDSYTEV